MKLKYVILVFALLAESGVFALNLQIDKGYQDEKGNLLIVFKDQFSHDILRDSNKFFGTSETLHQFKITSESSFRPEVYTFELNGKRNPRGEFRVLDSLKMVCGDNKDKVFSPISSDLKAKLEENIRRGKLPLRTLPDERYTIGLLRSKNEGHFIYVDGSYRSNGKVRLFHGMPKKMRELEVVNSGRRSQNGYFVEAEGYILEISRERSSVWKSSSWKNGKRVEYELEVLDLDSFDLKMLGITELPASKTTNRGPCDLAV